MKPQVRKKLKKDSLMRVFSVALLLALGISGCEYETDKVVRIDRWHTYGVTEEEWGVCEEACGETGLAEVNATSDEEDEGVLECSCKDLSEIYIELPTATSTVDGPDE